MTASRLSLTNVPKSMYVIIVRFSVPNDPVGPVADAMIIVPLMKNMSAPSSCMRPMSATDVLIGIAVLWKNDSITL